MCQARDAQLVVYMIGNGGSGHYYAGPTAQELAIEADALEAESARFAAAMERAQTVAKEREAAARRRSAELKLPKPEADKPLEKPTAKKGGKRSDNKRRPTAAAAKVCEN